MNSLRKHSMAWWRSTRDARTATLAAWRARTMRRVIVHDSEHRLLLLAYANRTPHYKSRVSMPEHLLICHTMVGRALVPSQMYYAVFRPIALSSMCFTVCNPMLGPELSLAVAGLAALRCGWAAFYPIEYLRDRMLMRADIDADSLANANKKQ